MQKGGGGILSEITTATFDLMKAPIEAAKAGVVAFEPKCRKMRSPPMFLSPSVKLNCHISPKMLGTVKKSK